jgi:hypothetical protein
MKNLFIITFIIFAFIIAGCGKKQETTANKEETATGQKSREQQKKEDSIKDAQGQMDKEAKVKEALEEEKIVNDTSGQWAIDAEASTTYGDHTGKDSWTPNQMTGKPDVENYGDDGKAWTSKEADKGLEWVQLTFPKAVYASEVRIRQTYNPGAIIKVELIDEKGKNHTVWEGVDKTKYPENKIAYFFAKFDKTDYKTKTVKISLATNSVQGWNEIDAVQLVGN